jgi:hypothetical protein
MTQVNTDQEYENAIESCRQIFVKKTIDYGTSWRVYRPISIADQIYIKAKRIRNIQEKGIQKINDDIADEFRGILNYAIIGLIQLTVNNNDPDIDWQSHMAVEEVTSMYDAKVLLAKNLMGDKNHDYGEAWRNMSQESFVDLILAKVLRIKQIVQNDGRTLMSEGIDANYFDIVNYAAFALILIGEN